MYRTRDTYKVKMNKKSNSQEIFRSDIRLKKMLMEIRKERFMMGRDKEPISLKRLSLAITRIPNIKNTLLNAQIRRNYE